MQYIITDRSLLYCILLSEDGNIDLDKDDWYQKLRDFRRGCDIENRSREEDVLSIKSISETSSAFCLNKSIVFPTGKIEDDIVFNYLTFNKNYKKFLEVTPTGVLLKCLPSVYFERNAMNTSYISDIINRVGVKFVSLLNYENFQDEESFKKYENGLAILKLPFAVKNMVLFWECNEYVKYVEDILKEDQKPLQSVNLNSLFGSYLIGWQTDKEKVLDNLFFSQTKWNVLVSILTSKFYSICLIAPWKEHSKELQSAFPVLRFESSVEESDINELVDIFKVLKKENNTVSFISDDTRHQVMSYFVKNCLITDDDYEKYIKLSSTDSLLEYVRPWSYEGHENERCLYLPQKIEDLLIEKLGVEALLHVMIELHSPDNVFVYLLEHVRKKVQENLKVPEEVLDWDYDARCIYVECAKKGKKTIHRARAMIVGCAGAGKTTLLKRLQKFGMADIKKVQPTVGLEIHEDMFELNKDSCLRALSSETTKDDKQILSVVDFGGQWAYYACHQVYLSGRAFYLLVIDMSKPFKEKVDKSHCEQRGTIFADWTYGEYVLFWLRSVHTYCAEDTSIIIVATHSENVTLEDKDKFYDNLLDLLPADSNLKEYLKCERCFFVSFPVDSDGELDPLTELEKYISFIAKDNIWTKNIPKSWTRIELALLDLKRDSKKIVLMEELKRKYWMFDREEISENGDKFKVALRFFHDIGMILYINEENLSDTIIVDVQWFVDTFKFIISDRKHIRDLAETNREWQELSATGFLRDRFLSQIWKSLSIDLQLKPTILHYMQRLGLVAIGTNKHYVPCMNKRDFGRKERIALLEMEIKSSVLVLHFHFLPFFFYCRLIVACIVETEWKVVEDDDMPCLFKNVCLFKYEDHRIALVVTSSAIQVQIFRSINASIDSSIAAHIRSTLDQKLRYLTSTFHKPVAYRIAFQCSSQDVLCENEKCYIYEEEISGKGQTSCPRHELTNRHMVDEENLTKLWKVRTPSISSAECGKVPLTNEEKITRLVLLGRDAMQEYFDLIFPLEDLQKCLTDFKEYLSKGQFKFTTDELNIVYPASGSVVTSSQFDVPIMYKLLRNFGNHVTPPTKGWGKEPEVGQKTHGDDIERIRKYRNRSSHNFFSRGNMDGDDFIIFWEELSQAIVRLTNGSFQGRIDSIREKVSKDVL